MGIFGLALMIPGRTAHAVPNGGYAHPEVLIQPEELRILMDKKDPRIRIIDIREKLKYLASHIPGAVHVWRPDIVRHSSSQCPKCDDLHRYRRTEYI